MAKTIEDRVYLKDVYDPPTTTFPAGVQHIDVMYQAPKASPKRLFRLAQSEREKAMAMADAWISGYKEGMLA